MKYRPLALLGMALLVVGIASYLGGCPSVTTAQTDTSEKEKAGGSLVKQKGERKQLSLEADTTVESLCKDLQTTAHYTVGDAGEVYNIDSYYGITGAELKEQLDNLSIETRSETAEIEGLANKPEVTMDDLVTIARRKRSIATSQLLEQMLVEGRYFALDQGGVAELDKLMQSRFPNKYRNLIHVRRFVARPSRNIHLVFVIDPDMDPKLSKARKEEKAINRDNRGRLAEDFNRKPLAEREQALARVTEIRRLLMGKQSVNRSELRAELLKLQPHRTRINEKTYRLVPTR